MENISLIHIPLIAGVVLCGQNPVSAADLSRATAVQPSTVGALPGKVIQSWLANSFSRDKGHHFVLVNIAGGSPGTEENACNLLIRLDHWSNPARRTKRWTINLPLNDKSYTPNTGYGGGAPLSNAEPIKPNQSGEILDCGIKPGVISSNLNWQSKAIQITLKQENI